MLRAALIRAGESPVLRRQATQRGLIRTLAMRFVAGETLDDGLRVARLLAAQGKSVTLDYLGESVTAEGEARAAAAVVLEALERMGAESLPGGVSVKPTQMGLHLDERLCAALLGDIVAAADAIDAHVTLDMEGSDVTEATAGMVEHLLAEGHPNVGCALQAYLRRTFDDVMRLTRAGASLRLCKGAYAEPATIAYQSRKDVDLNFARIAEWLLAHGRYPRFATHDDRLIERIRHVARRDGRPSDSFEFQMLYGVRTRLQDELVADGWRLRIYVPFGDQWYPYFMRRLAERPANVLFFLRALRGG